jgi:hypothetical protein
VNGVARLKWAIAGRKNKVKQLLLLPLLLFSVNAFCDLSEEEDLKNRFKEANDPISLEDFPDAMTEKPLSCSYRSRGTWVDMVGVASHSAVSVRPGKQGKGPLYSGSKGEQSITKGLVYSSTLKSNYDAAVFDRVTVVSKDHITWNEDRSIISGGHDIIFRKNGPYIFFLRTWLGGSEYGYCWREKNQ